MGMCKPSGGLYPMSGRVGSLPKIFKPNSRIDLFNKDGVIVQQGWYDADGVIIWYRDHAHGGGEHEWPHDHYANLNNHGDPRPPFTGPNGEKTNPNYC